jgi:uncharacterized beta-barrel protein YwiB (DUF1934 family)
MQMKEVVISVTGVQQTEDGPDVMELVTAGQYGVSPEEIRMTWEESELTGMAGTRTTFSVTPRKVVMTREGKVNSRMVFEEGKKNYFLYETPFGAATMGVDTNRIRAELGRNGGEMEVDYSIDVNQQMIHRHRFFIQIKEPEKSHIGDISWPI